MFRRGCDDFQKSNKNNMKKRDWKNIKKHSMNDGFDA